MSSRASCHVLGACHELEATPAQRETAVVQHRVSVTEIQLWVDTMQNEQIVWNEAKRTKVTLSLGDRLEESNINCDGGTYQMLPVMLSSATCKSKNIL